MLANGNWTKMSISFTTLEVPLRIDKSGVILVGKTRVPIDTVIAHHLQGATPEQIVERFDVLKLGDGYATIAYYLANRDEIDAYLQHGQEEKARIRHENEARFDNSELHARLLQAKKENTRPQ